MTELRDPPHYLRALSSSHAPKRLLWLDCQAKRSVHQGTWTDYWSGAALGETHWTSKKNQRKDWLDTFTDAAELWRKADSLIPLHRKAVLFAYDLGRQLRVSQALIHLPSLGWELDYIVLERTASWALLRHGTRTLLCCDLQSWCPVEFSRIRTEVNGGEKLPAEHAAGKRWSRAVAAGRVEVIRSAVLQILEWIDTEQLGPFRPTGSGQSYSAYRKRFMSDKLLVHDDTDRLHAERIGMWTGRCEAWRHGTFTLGPFIEYDMHAAYPTIGKECQVPTVAVGSMVKPDRKRIEAALEKYCLLAKVTVTTDLPIVPCKLGTRTVWPTGTFTTWLYDPELRLVLKYAKSFECHTAYKYRKAYALTKFCRYVLDGMTGQTQVYGTVPMLVMKHWSRSMIGRLGLRFRTWEKFGTTDDNDLRLVTFIDMDDGTATDMLCAGHNRLILTELRESTESLPQIPGWVMSECRRRLWETCMTIGPSHVMYMDTDSIILDATMTGVHDRMKQIAPEHDWVIKGDYDRLTIYGPRNIECESVRRVAGLPLSARQTAPLEFTGEVMRSIKESMKAGELDHVASIPRTFHIGTQDMRRQHLADTFTQPFQIEATDERPTDG